MKNESTAPRPRVREPRVTRRFGFGATRIQALARESDADADEDDDDDANDEEAFLGIGCTVVL